MKTASVSIIGVLMLAACHDSGTYTEHVACKANGKNVVYESRRTYGGHGGLQWVSGMTESGTVIRDHQGEVIIQYSHAIPCTLTKINYLKNE